MSTNSDAIESSSKAVVSAEPLIKSDSVVSNGVEVGDNLSESKTETLAMEPAAELDGSGHMVGDVSIGDARVSGDEVGIVKENVEKVLDEKKVKNDEEKDFAVQDLVHDARVSGDEKGIVSENVEKASDEIKVNNDEDKEGAVQDSVDDARVSGDEIGIVTEKVEKASDEIKVNNDEEMEGEYKVKDLVKNGEKVLDGNAVNNDVNQDLVHDVRVCGVETGIVKENVEKDKDETDDNKVKHLIDHGRDGDTVVQDSIHDARVSSEETEIATENVEKVSDETVANKVKDLVERDGGADTDTVVHDSVDNARVSGDETAIVTENVAKVSDDKVLNNDEMKEGVVQQSVDDARVSGDKTETAKDDFEKVLGENKVDNNEEKEDEHKVKVFDETEVNKVKELVDHDESGDTVVLDSINDEKVSNENKINNNEEKEGEYKVKDLVWAKVRSYPWWPGQIFDPSASTDKARKYSNKKGFLVAYFGDQSFAWNEASKIKPFRKNFSKMEKQSNSKSFSHAVKCALDEVSRRVEFGLSCSCISEEVVSKFKSQVFINAGIKKEASTIEGGDNFSTVATFKAANIVQSVQDLAKEHFEGVDRLDAFSVRAQLSAYYRWKGYHRIHEFISLPPWEEADKMLEDNSEVPSIDAEAVSEGEKDSSKKRKLNSCDSVSRKQKDDSRKKERSSSKVTPDGSSSVTPNAEKKRKKDSGKKTMDEGNESRKKEKSLTKVTPTVSASEEKKRKKDSVKRTMDEINESRTKERNGGLSEEKIRKKDSQKRTMDEIKESRTKERNGGSTEEKKRKKDSLKRKTVEINDSQEEENQNKVEDKKSSISPPKKLFRIGDTICRVAKQLSESPSILKKEPQKSKKQSNEHEADEDKTSKEKSATALILKFTNLDSIPSVENLNEIFSRYGAVRETETEVMKKNNSAKVVFEDPSNAETAFSSSGKFSIFGPSLISYRLDYSPTLRKTATTDEKQNKEDEKPVETIESEE